MNDPAERIESRHSRSVCLIGMGRLEEGFAEYEIRNHERFRAYVHHMTKAPQWQGEPLDGKRILVVGEQGLGDEFMFANTLPDLQRAVGATGKLQIAVDGRLVSLFQRSFPKAEVGRCEDRAVLDSGITKELRFIPFATEKGEPDFFTRMGSTLCVLRKRLEDFPHQAILKPDPERVAQLRETLRAGGPGPYVGICWRSMMLDAKRAKYYGALDLWGPILKTPGVRFVNLQYGKCEDELARARELHSVDIQSIDGLDRRRGGAVRRPRSGDLGAHRRGGVRRQHRDRSVVYHRWVHLAAARHRRIPLVPQEPRLQPGEIRRLERADAAGRRAPGRLRGELNYCCCCCC
jgi:hypothetical protein